MPTLPMSDRSGHWFDPEKVARVWKECPDQNEVDRRIRQGDDDQEEELYLTQKGTLILYNRQRQYEYFGQIDIETAARWLIANGHQSELSQLELGPEEK